ncbi:MAG: GNAT family N-acetyltransferase [Thiotrichales bacterium]|nr:GNAT family N-acetyltransferase [Thiotrichales bacterium]
MSPEVVPNYASLRLVHLFNQFAPRQAIRNLQTELELFQHNGRWFPLTRNQTEYDNSYICSFYTAYVAYARAELSLIQQPLQRWGLHKTSYLAALILRLARINQTVCLNNWLFSTNPMHWLSAEEMREISQRLVQQNPFHNLSIRSLNRRHNSEFMTHLEQQGWLLIPARQVYLFAKDGDWQTRNNVKNDWRLLRKTQLQLRHPLQHQAEDFTVIEQRFRQLFIDKHSAFNPQFSANYLYGLHEQKLLEFFSFCDAQGRIMATLGVFTENGIMTAPIVGYDTEAPKQLGLYRLVIGQLLKLAAERKLELNLSAGAGEFKRNRGGEAVIEYSAFYCRHLPWMQRQLLSGFAKLLNRYAPKVFAENPL